MAYARSGIPHHDTGKVAEDVTGWDMGCLTLECYVNNLAKGRGGNHRRKGGLLRNGKRAGGRHYRGKGKPRRIEPTGRGDGLGLITRQGRQNEKQSEKEAKPKVT